MKAKNVTKSLLILNFHKCSAYSNVVIVMTIVRTIKIKFQLENLELASENYYCLKQRVNFKRLNAYIKPILPSKKESSEELSAPFLILFHSFEF